MRNNFAAMLLVTLLLTGICNAQSKNEVQSFASDIISKFPNVRDLALSPDEKEIYFTVQSYTGELSAIVCCKMQSGKWSEPEVASFSGKFQDLEPFFSSDGLRLYFVSDRPVSDSSLIPKDYDIWMVERKTSGSSWQEPVNLGAPVNTSGNEFYPCVTNSGNLYLTSDGEGSKGKDDIFICTRSNGKWQRQAVVSDSVNSDGYEFNAFVSPDEAFMIYTCYNKPGGFGSGDLYISYKIYDKSWSAPVNLGKDFNSPQMDYCPFVDLKNGMLYFTSKRTSIKNETPVKRNLQSLLVAMNSYENGQSRLYVVPFKVKPLNK